VRGSVASLKRLMYQFHRIFCATSWELERERADFYNAVSEFNQAHAMQFGVLYVPVSLVNVRDKRPLQYAIDENIRACRHYILAVESEWGPRERHFQRDYQLALECAADPDLPMAQIAVLLHPAPAGITAEPSLPKPDGEFSSLEQFRKCVFELLSSWLGTLLDSRANDAAHSAGTVAG
jgi:hypothetical protein